VEALDPKPAVTGAWLATGEVDPKGRARAQVPVATDGAASASAAAGPIEVVSGALTPDPVAGSPDPALAALAAAVEEPAIAGGSGRAPAAQLEPAGAAAGRQAPRAGEAGILAGELPEELPPGREEGEGKEERGGRGSAGGQPAMAAAAAAAAAEERERLV